ncbi:hypothetical protein QQF64_006628 [Cirrhinus molitorella]|uniref:Uncharacterized protein n=1 Tax=Cirrhinus molitorella TaxID=172907 RepID=A0ABR3MCG9_9TELE
MHYISRLHRKCYQISFFFNVSSSLINIALLVQLEEPLALTLNVMLSVASTIFSTSPSPSSSRSLSPSLSQSVSLLTCRRIVLHESLRFTHGWISAFMILLKQFVL